MKKEILETTLPWILYPVLCVLFPAHVELAVIIAGLSSIIFEIKNLRKGFVLSWGSVVFFVFMFVNVCVFHNQFIAHYSWIMTNSALVLIAVGSIILGKPFTMQYAREMVSEDKWRHPLFIKINYIMTAFWGVIFLLGIIIHVVRIYYPELGRYTYEFFTYSSIIFGVWFSKNFPRWYRKRRQVQ